MRARQMSLQSRTERCRCRNPSSAPPAPVPIRKDGSAAPSAGMTRKRRSGATFVTAFRASVSASHVRRSSSRSPDAAGRGSRSEGTRSRNRNRSSSRRGRGAMKASESATSGIRTQRPPTRRSFPLQCPRLGRRSAISRAGKGAGAGGAAGAMALRDSPVLRRYSSRFRAVRRTHSSSSNSNNNNSRRGSRDPRVAISRSAHRCPTERARQRAKKGRGAAGVVSAAAARAAIPEVAIREVRQRLPLRPDPLSGVLSVGRLLPVVSQA